MQMWARRLIIIGMPGLFKKVKIKWLKMRLIV